MYPDKNSKASLILLHAIAWLAFGMYLYLVNYLARPVFVIQILAYLIPLCGVFYANLYCLGFFNKKGLLKGLALFLAFFISILTLEYYYIYSLLEPIGIHLYASKEEFLPSTIFNFVQMFAFALVYFWVEKAFQKERTLRLLQEQTFKLEQEKKQHELENALLRQQELEAEQERLQLEFAFLRSQVNPHFLHNTLNVLFSQALPLSEELANNIMKLSSMMRYSLESVQMESGVVDVAKELKNLEILIDIHQVRFSRQLSIDYVVTGEANGQKMPPMSIITAVENAFKYGDLRDPQNPLKISVNLTPKEIRFVCLNKKKHYGDAVSSHNIGIKNLSRRLDFAFKNKYEINAQNLEDMYIFELTIRN